MAHPLQKVFAELDMNPYAYSGRAMFGRKCLAVNIDSDMGEFIGSIIEVCCENDDASEIAHAFRRMRTDAMGLGTVVYFPGIEFSDDEDEEEEFTFEEEDA